MSLQPQSGGHGRVQLKQEENVPAKGIGRKWRAGILGATGIVASDW
jgi:hypothetical protein